MSGRPSALALRNGKGVPPSVPAFDQAISRCGLRVEECAALIRND